MKHKFEIMLVLLGVLGLALTIGAVIVVKSELHWESVFQNKCHSMGGKVISRSYLCVKGDSIILRG